MSIAVILTAINTLRNSDGREKNWSCPIEYVSIFNRHGSQTAKLREAQLLKAVIGQVAALIIVPIAVIETIVYTALTAISLVFYRYTHMPYTFSMNLLKSSSFTIVWVFSKIEYYWVISIREDPLAWFQSNQERQRRLVILLVINAVIATTSFFFGKHMLRNEPTHESFARQKISSSWFFRDEDKVEIIRQCLPSATENFIQHCVQNDTIWRGLMVLLNTLPNQLENYLRNLNQRHRGEPVIALNEDEEQDDENYTYICAIGLGPLIDPVQDPTAIGTNPVLYEREAIIHWLSTNSISPYTRHRLRISELLEIDTRLPETEVRVGIREQQERIARKRANREIA